MSHWCRTGDDLGRSHLRRIGEFHELPPQRNATELMKIDLASSVGGHSRRLASTSHHQFHQQAIHCFQIRLCAPNNFFQFSGLCLRSMVWWFFQFRPLSRPSFRRCQAFPNR
jgi:hypothetical protein